MSSNSSHSSSLMFKCLTWSIFWAYVFKIYLKKRIGYWLKLVGLGLLFLSKVRRCPLHEMLSLFMHISKPETKKIDEAVAVQARQIALEDYVSGTCLKLFRRMINSKRRYHNRQMKFIVKRVQCISNVKSEANCVPFAIGSKNTNAPN